MLFGINIRKTFGTELVGDWHETEKEWVKGGQASESPHRDVYVN